MENNVTLENWFVYIRIAYHHNLESFKEKCFNFMAENRKELDGEILNDLPKNILIDFIQL